MKNCFFREHSFRERLLSAGIVQFFFLVGVLFPPAETTGETLVFPPYGHSYGIRKATPAHLFMFFGPRTFFDNPQGLATTRLTVWDDSTTENDDDEVVVYGVNCNRHQIIYNTSMWTLGLYGKKGHGRDGLYFPKGITADRHGHVFVADSGNNRVVRLFNPGSKLRWVSSFDGKSGTDNGLIGPSRISMDEKGTVYVTDTGNRRIAVFSSDGRLLRTVSCGSSAPTALVAADGRVFWSKFRDECLLFYAVDNGRLLVKSTFDGKVLKKERLPEGYAASYGATDYYHNYWITDSRKHCVLKYDHHLNLCDIFGSYGKKDNQFVEPRGITIYKRYGQTFIAEKKGAQYYWVGTDLKSASLSEGKGKNSYTLTVAATEYSFCSLFSASGTDTTFYLKRRRIDPYSARVSLHKKGNDFGEKELKLRLEPTYSSYTYYAWYYPVKLHK